MTYLVLARKYRPQTFSEVAGQDAVVRTLKRALASERVHHAFLFTGSRGVGKTTLARLMAKALTCAEGPTPDPCGVCEHCTGVAGGTAVDVVEIDGASNTSVDDVRELREQVRYQPSAARFKIFIIDEVHMLSDSAFNALLKTLEEPPPHVKFVFATTEPHKIPITILSRCQRYDFKRIGTDVIVAHLQAILAKENIEIDAEGLRVIATAADGGMRDALSLTDQVISFAGNGASFEAVTEALGVIDRRSVVRLTRALAERDAASALDVVARAFAQGHDLKQLADAVASEFRHVSIARAVGSVKGYVDLADEAVAGIDALANTLDPQDAQRLFAMALKGVDEVARAEHPRLAMELLALRMLDRPVLAEAAFISQAMTRLETMMRGKPVGPLGAEPPPVVVREVRAALGQVAPAARVVQAPGAPAADPESDLRSPVAPAPAAIVPEPTPEREAPPRQPIPEREAPPRQPIPEREAPPRQPSPEREAPPRQPSPERREPAPEREEPARQSAPARQEAPRQSAPERQEPPRQSAPRDQGPPMAPHPADQGQMGAPHPADQGEQGLPDGWWAAVEQSKLDQAELTSHRRDKAANTVSDETAALDAEIIQEMLGDDEDHVDPAAGLDLEGVDERWLAVVDHIAPKSRQIAVLLEQGRVVSADKDVHVAFERRYHREAIEAHLESPLLLEALGVHYTTGAALVIARPTKDAAPSISTARQTAIFKARKALIAYIEAHPAVHAAMEIFGGKIRRVVTPND